MDEKLKKMSIPISVLVILLSLLSCAGGARKSSNEDQTNTQELWEGIPYAFAFGRVSEDGKHVVTEGVSFGDKLDRIYAFENKSINIVSHFDRDVITVHAPVDTLAGDAYKVLYAEEEDTQALSDLGGLVVEERFFENYSSQPLEALNFEIPPRPIEHLKKRAEELRPIINERYGCKIERISPLCATTAEEVVFYQANLKIDDGGYLLTIIIMDTPSGVISYREDVPRDIYAGRSDTDEILQSCFPYPSVHAYFKGLDGTQLVILTDNNEGLGIYQLYKVKGDILVPFTPKPWKN